MNWNGLAHDATGHGRRRQKVGPAFERRGHWAGLAEF